MFLFNKKKEDWTLTKLQRFGRYIKKSYCFPLVTKLTGLNENALKHIAN